jgi:hypothetical protein
MYINFIPTAVSLQTTPPSLDHHTLVSFKGAPGRGGGGWAAAPPNPPNRNLKNADFADIMLSNFYAISLSAKISH